MLRVEACRQCTARRRGPHQRPDRSGMERMMKSAGGVPGASQKGLSNTNSALSSRP